MAAESACIFCGGSDMSDEHLFGKWAGRALAKDPRGLSRKGKHVVRVEAIDQTTEQTWESQAILDFVARCVCKRCNNGWMSAIEKRAQPIISSMILGSATVLDTNAQEIVGAWVALKATLLRYGHVPHDPLPRNWLDHWYQHHLPPNSWSAWVGSYVGRIPAHYAGRRVTQLFPRIPGLEHAATTTNGIYATILIGQFATQIFGVNWGAPQQHFPECLFRVWPIHEPQFAPLLWPPPQYISDQSLKAFEERLLTG